MNNLGQAKKNQELKREKVTKVKSKEFSRRERSSKNFALKIRALIASNFVYNNRFKLRQKLIIYDGYKDE